MDLAGREGGAATPRRPRRHLPGRRPWCSASTLGPCARAALPAARPEIISRMPNAVRRIGLGTVFALLAGTLVLGHALKVPCASGEWATTASTRACATRSTCTSSCRAAARGRLPFLDACADSTGECDEYQCSTMWTMRVAAWISSPSATGYFYASAIMLWIAAFVTAFCLLPLVGDRVLYFALAFHARAVRDDELGPACGRARHSRDAGIPATKGRLVGGAPRARSGGQDLPDVPRGPVRRRPLPRGEASRDRLAGPRRGRGSR